jgi:hypothetical protein
MREEKKKFLIQVARFCKNLYKSNSNTVFISLHLGIFYIEVAYRQVWLYIASICEY